MFEIISSKVNIDFIGKSKVYFAVSILVCIACVGLLAAKGFNYGVDFSGGTVVQVRFENPPSIEEIRSQLSSKVQGSISIQNFGEPTDFLIKAEQTTGDLQAIAEGIESVLTTSFANAGEVTIQRVEQVGPQVGSNLKSQAIMAVLYAIVGILIYVAVRFELWSAICSIVALMHDIIITLGAIVLFNITFDLTVLAAVLTVVGYSLNDKIVIFDRIREKSREDANKPLNVVMNNSINQTLSRTVLTSLSTLLAVISLYIFGGEVISGFAFTLFIGIIVGTYSSIGIASSLVYHVKLRMAKK